MASLGLTLWNHLDGQTYFFENHWYSTREGILNTDVTRFQGRSSSYWIGPILENDNGSVALL